ncbi:MAG: AAA domain-containing protein [Fulvivirga sp.]|uniref:AAA domain-containing protein n=1 Tax=Fulvivirga sp. TaxID=1931237 RepID=UPI0032EB3840
MHEILKSYLKRLTNLTLNNRSLFLLRLNKDQFIDLYDFNFHLKEGAFQIIESLIGGHRLPLCQQFDSRDEETNVSSSRLKRISRTEKFIYEERGSKDLYVGWPFVKGKLSDGTPVRCPLLFFPVDLELQSSKWLLKPRPDEGPSLNKSFLLAYAHYNNVSVVDDFIDRNLEDFDTDSTVFRTSLYQLFKESDIELNFNQDNFQDTLQKFEEYTKSDYEEKFGTGELKLFPEAVLGIFPQSGSYLVPDYNKLLSSDTIKDIEQFFISVQPEKKENIGGFLESVEEEKTFTPFKMDAHQENALKAIKKGQSIVVQGPPGTGKSQLICNLISDHIATGKKVLVVSQKRAALDVVYNRMKEKELTSFLGLVHDFKNDRKAIFENIARQVDRIDEYRMLNNGLDAIQLERKFLQVSRRIDQISEELEEFKFALFDESECGVAVKELYLTSDQNAQTVNFKQEYSQFRLDELDDFLIKLRDYTEYIDKFGRSDYEWLDRRSFKDYGIAERQRLNEILDEIPAYQDEIAARALDIVGTKLTLEDFEFILSKRDYIVQMLGTLKDENAYEYFQHLNNYSDSETSALWISNIERVVMECYKGEGPEVSIPSDQLGKFQETLQRNMDARKNLFRLIKWRLFSKDKYWIKRVLVENGLKRNKEGFKRLVERIDNRLNLEHNITKMKERGWIMGIPTNYEKVQFQTWFHLFKLTIKAKLIFNSLRNFKQYFNVQKITYGELKEKIEQLFEIIKETPQRKEKWLLYLTESQILSIENNTHMATLMKDSLKADFEALCDFDRVRDEMEPGQMKALDKLIQDAKVSATKELEKVFQNSIRLAWIDHIETKYPILRSVSSRKFHKLEAELQNTVKEKLSVTNDMLLLRAREKTYVNAEHNRLNNMVTYRDLYHQVTKKRRVWPLRKLIAEHSDELFDLVPCWLASPESVSAIFPMREMFDLVIFDEASQCFAEKGIPAMYRGRKVLIAGDSKQLRPNDLYQVRFDDESEVPELEVDSLLELADRYLMNIQLNGHYRSRSLDLIDFSNQHFYQGKLKLLPDFDVVNTPEPGIEYLKVDGVWENNINAIEADKVVDLLLSINGSSNNSSVGVVTFNAKQQQHILDRIDEKFIEQGVLWPEGWFVKNIENVQGDEKDIIIFSTAYGPDPKGKIVMQFGSLNAAGGENRLNVAVTRAREKVIIVSSLMPQQLKVEDTKNEGPKLLKKYLEYAFMVSEGNFKPTLPAVKPHAANWYLKTQLMSWVNEHSESFTLTEELPFTDITVKQGNLYRALLLTDDDLYYQSPSIKDVHVYTPFTLSKKKWRFRGFFSREWWSHREQVEETILRFVEGS